MNQSVPSIESRTNLSKTQIGNLLIDGIELIENVRKANERREHRRCIVEETEREKLINNLENESILASKKINKIILLWEQLDNGPNDPKVLNDGIQLQETNIKQLLKQKSEIINELQILLKSANQQYYSDQIKQQFDIQCLIGRIDEQIELMKNIYREHLELLHQSIDAERIQFKQCNTLKWQQYFDKVNDNNLKNINLLHTKQDQYNLNKLNLYTKYEELIRNTRIKLDLDNDLLLRKIQKIKFETILKAEQLNYNHYVLRKRSIENAFVRNKQKLRSMKLKQFLQAIKIKSIESKRIWNKEIEWLTNDLIRLYENCKEIEMKINVFNDCNNKKFLNLWKFNENMFEKKIHKICDIDHVIFEQHLFIQYQDNNKKLMNRNDLKSMKMVNAILCEQSNEGKYKYKLHRL